MRDQTAKGAIKAGRKTPAPDQTPGKEHAENTLLWNTRQRTHRKHPVMEHPVMTTRWMGTVYGHGSQVKPYLAIQGAALGMYFLDL